jgi:hypothetical protein
MSDLIRAHEGNAESNPDYPNKIHWGKFNMIGKFVHSTTLCQVQCRSTQDYNFKENTHVRKLLQQSVMTIEVCVFDSPVISMLINELHRCKGHAWPHPKNLSKTLLGSTHLERILAMSRVLVNLVMLQILSENSFHGNRSVPAKYSVSEYDCCITLPGYPRPRIVFVCLPDCIPVTLWAA